MYNWRKDIATWEVGKTLYISVPFTWLVDKAQALADKWKGKAIIGGPGLMKPTECEGFEPLLFHNPCATFTTRGCPNSCSFCAVPRLEGGLREIKDFRPAPVICDNNLLSASRQHIERVVEAIKQFPFVDFNQGLEARRFTPAIADLFGKLHCKVRFAFDTWGSEKAVTEAVRLCQERTTKNISVYCLIGYKDKPDDAKARLELIRSWGVYPNAMRYQPLDAKEKNSYVAPDWTERQLLDMSRYYNRLAWLEHIPFEEYRSRNEQMTLPI